MTAWYNEIDPNAAAWLRELITRGLIAPGVVDERSVDDVRPSDLAGYTQCHFFAGIGVWSYALRQAGWPDDRPVWTGSCPCQPFSAAGKGGGFDDERHLWPAWHWLIDQCRPAIVFGEQVASKDAEPWIDLVSTDLEAVDYGVGAVPFPSAGVGAPHIRDRLYWVAESAYQRHEWSGFARGGRDGLADLGAIGGLADSELQRRRLGEPWSKDAADAAFAVEAGGLADADGRNSGAERQQRGGEQRQQSEDGVAGGVADSNSIGAQRQPGDASKAAAVSQGQRQPEYDAVVPQRGGADRGGRGNLRGHGLSGHATGAGPTNGLWRDADWLHCRDGKWRPVEPGAQQMVDGSTASLGRLRDSSIREIEAAVEAWALRHQRDGAEAVRSLWDLLSSEEAGQRQDGGFDSVREAPFLLALLRQLSNQGWKFPLGDERASAQASRTALRVLRFDEQAAYSSRGRGLDEQRPDEPSDPLRELSQIVAHFAEECWGLSGWQNVGSFPLVIGAKARVSRLRGYGNAINAEAATVWVEAYLDASRVGAS